MMFSPRPLSRRDALRVLGASAVSIAITGCRQLGASTSEFSPVEGRLAARPHAPSKTATVGASAMGLDPARDAFLYIPKSYRADTPAPLAVLLHGAGQEAHELFNPLQPLADEFGLVLAAPNSRDSSWDIRYGAFGDDVAFINKMLERVFDAVNIAPSKISLCGFSDGASYALSLGPTNGDLFGHVVAFSPGFMVHPNAVGRPKIFITHGTADRILNIDATSRKLVPSLKSEGYDVQYREFDGPHTPPRQYIRDVVKWMVE
jgi:phospholipase/carboxylesterase